MDYLNLILAGYSDSNSREHLQDYFYVEYKKAEQQFYSTDLFFGGCLKVIEFFESDLKKQLNEYKNELYEGFRITTDNEAKAYFTDELNNISLDNFFFNLHHQSWPQQYLYFNRLQYSEIQNIKKAILDTEIKVNSEQIKETIKKISELESIKSVNNQKNQLTGFTCKLHPDTVKEIFNLMVTSNQISCHVNDFQAIFADPPTHVETPVKWLLKHNGKPNKTALFTFIKMILVLDEMPRDILRQANSLFKCGKENIFPENCTYPSIEEQRNSYKTRFRQIKQTYFPDFLKE